MNPRRIEQPGRPRAARRGRARRTAIAVVVALVAVACGGDGDGDNGGDSDTGAGSDTTKDETTSSVQGDTTTAPAAAPAVERFAPDDTGFHDVPDPLPAGDHGDLIRVQPVEGAPAGARWQRIMYLSESVTGEPIAVTGVVTLPDTEAPAGGWPPRRPRPRHHRHSRRVRTVGGPGGPRRLRSRDHPVEPQRGRRRVRAGVHRLRGTRRRWPTPYLVGQARDAACSARFSPPDSSTR
ncbi:MAG: hypothetical protein M5U19_17965 [Microthrixaceae bacterium]|nr:hypothetical protein [Microthrixaceae bacterium]